VHRTGLAPLRLFLAIAIPVLAFLTLGSWALSSPVASSPDEDFHLASTWCGLGDREGLCEDTGGGTARSIPTPLTTATCFAFDAQQSAACWDPDSSGMTEVARANIDGLYPRVFYAVMSVFASPDIQLSVILMRLVNAAFAVGLLTAVFWTLPRRLRPALLVSVLATSVPLGLFVYASTNPSSWAMLSAATVWITLYGATQTAGRQRLTLAVFAVVGTIVGAGARADAAAYAVFAVVIAMTLGLRAPRSQRVPLAAALGAIAIAVAFYLGAAQGGAVVSGLASDSPPLTPGQIVDNLLNVPTLWTGALGGWPLGWIDTVMPGVVPVLSALVFTGAIFVGIRHADGRRMLAIIVALLAIWAVPFVLLYQSRAVVGDLVQPRYILPLMVIALGVASLRRDGEAAWRGPRIALAGLSLTVAMSVALHTNIQRYTVGSESLRTDPGADAEWWWAGAPSPLSTWIVGTLAFGGIFILLGIALGRDRARPAGRTARAAESYGTEAQPMIDAAAVDRVDASMLRATTADPAPPHNQRRR
jgi:hypothetical protein